MPNVLDVSLWNTNRVKREVKQLSGNNSAKMYLLPSVEIYSKVNLATTPIGLP